MPIRTSEVSTIANIALPPLRQTRRVGGVAIRIEAAQERTVSCSASVSHAANGNVLALTVTLATGDDLRVESKSLRTREELAQTCCVRATELAVFDGLLTMSGADWITHPDMPAADLDNTTTKIRDSWKAPLSFEVEQRDAQGEITRGGLRPPQIGALHALAAHRR